MDSHTGKILRARCHGATALHDSPHIKGRQTTTRTETNTDVSALDSVGSWLPQALGSVCRLIRGCGGSRLSESQSLPPRCDSRCSAFVFIFHHFLRLFRPKQLHLQVWVGKPTTVADGSTKILLLWMTNTARGCSHRGLFWERVNTENMWKVNEANVPQVVILLGLHENKSHRLIQSHSNSFF